MLWICFLCIKPGHFHGNWHLSASWMFAWVWHKNCHAFLNSIVLIYPSVMIDAGRGEGQHRKRQKRSCHLRRNCCIQLLYLMFPCSQKILFEVHAERFRVQTAVFQGYSQLTLFSSRRMECMEHSSYSFFATPGQMRSNCMLCVVICCKLYLSLTDLRTLDLAYPCEGIPLNYYWTSATS